MGEELGTWSVGQSAEAGALKLHGRKATATADSEPSDENDKDDDEGNEGGLGGSAGPKGERWIGDCAQGIAAAGGGAEIALETGEVAAQIGGSLIAEAGFFFEKLEDDAFQFGGSFRIGSKEAGRCFVEDGVEERGTGCAPEWERAGCHLVEDHAEAEEVAAGIDFIAKSLFGTHVGSRADGDATIGAEGSHRG